MLKLTPKSSDPVWLDLLPGVRVKALPVTIPMILIARRAAADAYPADGSTQPDTGARANTNGLGS